MSHPALSWWLATALVACAPSGTMQTRADPPSEDISGEAGCAGIRPGMNYRDALERMGREPDSTLSGHTAAGPAGHPPAGSFAIDFWNDIDAQGRPSVRSLRYSGGAVEEVECGQTPAAAPLSAHDGP